MMDFFTFFTSDLRVSKLLETIFTELTYMTGNLIFFSLFCAMQGKYKRSITPV